MTFGLTGAPPIKFELTAVDRTAAAFAKVQRNLSLIDQRVMAVNRAATGMLGGKLLGSLGGTMMVAALVDPIGKVSEAMEEFGRIAERVESTGLSTDFYQTLGVAALQMGVDQEQLNSALIQFTARVGEARAGTGALVQGYRDLNPELLAAIRNSKDTEEALRLVADEVKKGTSADEKARIAKIAAGRAWGDFVRVLSLGSDGLDAWMVKARETGQLIDGRLIKQQDELSDRYEDATDVLDKQWKRVLVELSPVLVASAESTAKLAKAGRDFAESGFGSALIDVASALRADPFQTAAAGIQRLTRSATGTLLSNPGEVELKIDPPLPGQFRRDGEDGSLGDKDGQRDRERAAERLKDTIRDLELESQMLGLSARQQAIYNAHKSAGLDPLLQYNAALGNLAGKIYDSHKRFEDLDAAAAVFGDVAFDGIERLALRGEELNDVLADTASMLAKMTLQAALLGQGPLGGILGTSPASGSLGGLFGAIFGGSRASGGPIEAGKAYRVHQDEWIVPARDGTVIPASRGAGRSGDIVFAPTIILPPASASGDGRSQDAAVRTLTEALHAKFKQWIAQERRHGGALN